MRERTEQLQLLHDAPGEEHPFSCSGIFSANYLTKHLRAAEGFPTPEEVLPLYEAAKTRWNDNVQGLRRQKEAYTRAHFIDPLLADLGWQFIPETDLPKGPKAERPDYCLFPTAEARQNAAAQSETAEIFRYADTVLEAKKWQHSLDEVSKSETPGWFPSQQIQSYLRHAKDNTGRRFFNWAILSNGNLWRLYCEQAANDAYFEFVLADEGTFCSLEDFCLFVALFRPSAFARSDGRCWLDDIREEALTRQAELELSLRRRIFDVLEDLANAFRDYTPNGISEKDYPAVYENSLILLYRLLFVLYAESRALLPVKPHGHYGSNKIYREKFSLARLVGDLRDSNKFTDEAFTDLYEQLLKLFELINGEDAAKNEATKVPRYNGGLFNPALHPLLKKWRISDASLSRVLKQLIFAQPPARSSARQQQIFTAEAIDYASLEVRQLGDIYEGLLGAHLEENERGRLELRNEKGQNHRQGIYYTPDWIVRYLIRETFQPLLGEIEASGDVQAALKAKSDEKRRGNSFALAVLRLNLVDPAMGSGHFLVRATEWLAEQIVYHPTTRLMTEQIVHNGTNRRTREEIEKAGRIPVPPGVSHEQAEIAHWRRRIVEACIYGVDLNPLAVELTKLSLWLTCIAADEPLNFLDHHLRDGNSLLFVRPDDLSHSPVATAQQREEPPVFPKGDLSKALAAVIKQNVDIERHASTEMDLVKQKERRWKEVRSKLEPFLRTADLWLASYDGLPMDELNYRLLARAAITPDALDNREKAEVKKLRESLADALGEKAAALQAFHWELEFADVFFKPDGSPRLADERGFDAVLGNPPYISTHTSSAEKWRSALERRAGFLDDLYVHFTDLSFRLLRPGGGFGFIVSDTFFTLASKLRMRELLQSNSLTHLGQCDPFEATVDAAIFVVKKGNGREAASDDRLLFVQARPKKTPDGRSTQPDKFLNTLPETPKLTFDASTQLSHGLGQVERGIHGPHGTLRIHRAPVELYRRAHNRAFFEPQSGTLKLFEKFNEPVQALVQEWWERIETSQRVTDHLATIRAYQSGLKPGDITLVGLVAEGGQGMRTANNARFLGYLEGTPQADWVLARREAWMIRWLAEPRIKPVFVDLLKQQGGDPNKPTKNGAAWEACVESLRAQFTPEQLGFNKSDLYRVVPKALVADESDFEFTWQQRKAELLKHWRTEKALADFWTKELKDSDARKRARRLHKSATVFDEDFCLLCQELQSWVAEENASRKRQRKPTISWEALGLRSAENYTDAEDAPRIATIYNGLCGRGRFVPFRKGDPEGNRWLDNEPLYVDWTKPSVEWLSTAPEARWQGHRMFLTSGVCWSLHANHVAVKARLQPACVFDASGSRLTPNPKLMSAEVFVAILNSDVFSFFLKKFLKHNQDVEINDLRQMPLVVPSKQQTARLQHFAELALAAKRLEFTGRQPPHDVANAVRAISDDLDAQAPAYLRPPAQRKLLATATDCLEIIELAVNWEAEKLYGVEGAGPFDEF